MVAKHGGVEAARQLLRGRTYRTGRDAADRPGIAHNCRSALACALRIGQSACMPVTYMCFACGYDGLLEPPWTGDSGGSDEICPSCGLHFGYHDAAGGDPARREAVYRTWRAAWVARGMEWWSPEGAPEGWDAAAQLRAVAE